MRHRPIRVVLDLALLLLAVLGLLRILLRRPTLAEAGLAWLAIPWGLHVLLVFGLLVLRARPWQSTSSKATPRPWPGREALFPCAAFLLVLALVQPTGANLGADGGVYFEQLSDVLLEGRLLTPAGAEPGTVVLWAPFFLLGHGVARLAALAGASIGASAPYANAFRIGGAVYGLLAAVFAQRAASRFASPIVASVCAAGFWLASPLYHYTVAEPIMTHAPCAALSSLLVLLWLRAREAPENPWRWVAVALAGGLLVATQRYDAYLLLPALVSGAAVVRRQWRTGDAAARRRTALAVGATAAAFALAVTPLVALALATPGRFLLNPETIRSQMLSDWARPHVGPLLFSSNSGLFAWTPLAVPAVFGLALLVRRDRTVGLTLLVTLALGVYVLASTPTWASGWSFGARRLTEAYPILVLGLCLCAEAVLRRPWVPALALLSLFVVQNVLFSARMRLGLTPMGDAQSFMRVVQGAASDFYLTVGHPGSWPANWIFAVRHGVTPDRFDELYGRVPQGRLAFRLGSPEEGAALGRGWSRVEEGETGRWTDGEDATLLPTLTAPADRTLRLRGTAARHPGGLAQTVDVEVNGHWAGRVALTPEGQSWETRVPADSWRPGLNEILFRPAWRLSRKEAWAVDEPPFAAWRLEEVVVEPVS